MRFQQLIAKIWSQSSFWHWTAFPWTDWICPQYATNWLESLWNLTSSFGMFVKHEEGALPNLQICILFHWSTSSKKKRTLPKVTNICQEEGNLKSVSNKLTLKIIEYMRITTRAAKEMMIPNTKTPLTAPINLWLQK